MSFLGSDAIWGKIQRGWTNCKITAVHTNDTSTRREVKITCDSTFPIPGIKACYVAKYGMDCIEVDYEGEKIVRADVPTAAVGDTTAVVPLNRTAPFVTPDPILQPAVEENTAPTLLSRNTVTVDQLPTPTVQ